MLSKKSYNFDLFFYLVSDNKIFRHDKIFCASHSSYTKMSQIIFVFHWGQISIEKKMEGALMEVPCLGFLVGIKDWTSVCM